MGFNKQNITLHRLYVYDDAHFSVGRISLPLLHEIEAAERFETWGGGGELIVHSAIRTPLLKFFKMPFALAQAMFTVSSVSVNDL